MTPVTQTDEAIAREARDAIEAAWSPDMGSGELEATILAAITKAKAADLGKPEQKARWDWDERVTEFHITCNGQTLFRVHDEWTARNCVREHNATLRKPEAVADSVKQ